MVASAANLEYALDFAKPDDPLGAKERYYFRTSPVFETGDGGVIHRVFEVQ
jgi:hypothetical protein